MADASLIIPVAPEATYMLKPNIRFPGTSAQATAAATRAAALVNDRLPSGVTIAGGTITVAT